MKRLEEVLFYSRMGMFSVDEHFACVVGFFLGRGVWFVLFRGVCLFELLSVLLVVENFFVQVGPNHSLYFI